MNDKINEFRDWMDEHRLKAADVCGALHVSEQAIHNWRSAGVPPRRRPHVERYMSEWVDLASPPAPGVSDAAVQSLAESRQNLVLHPTRAAFDAWSAAFKASQARTFSEWAIEGLNQLAGHEEGNSANGTDGP